jgi:pimeloyl-ACP methyl ester carboxylesterase
MFLVRCVEAQSQRRTENHGGGAMGDAVAEAAEQVATWEALGQRLDVDGSAVWWADLPALGDEDGDPILVLHGFPTASFDWRHVTDALRATRRVVLLDFPGFGLSDKPDRRNSIRLCADAVEAVADAAGLRAAALVTHDMGDTVGGELLARDLEGDLPFAVTQRVLSNGSIYLDLAQLTPGQQMLLALPDERFDLAAAGGDPQQSYKAAIAATMAEAYQPDDVELEAQWLLKSRQDGHTLLARLIRYIEDRRAEESRFTGAIEQHHSPLGVVWGRLDPIAVAAMPEKLAQVRPRTPIIWLEDVAHYPMVETPERFANAVLHHLARLS